MVASELAQLNIDDCGSVIPAKELNSLYQQTKNQLFKHCKILHMQLFLLRVVWRRTSVFILAKGMTIEELNREKKDHRQSNSR